MPLKSQNAPNSFLRGLCPERRWGACTAPLDSLAGGEEARYPSPRTPPHSGPLGLSVSIPTFYSKVTRCHRYTVECSMVSCTRASIVLFSRPTAAVAVQFFKCSFHRVNSTEIFSQSCMVRRNYLREVLHETSRGTVL